MTQTINYRRILLSSVVIAFVASLVFAGTQAFFSDTETSEANTFTAGALDLKVDSQSHFNGLICEETSPDVYEWQADGVTFVDNNAVPAGHYPQPGDPCEGTWEETDLGIEHRFFNFDDIKPGDYGENTISLHVYDNDAWGCFYVENVENDDNGLTEPEEESGDATGGAGEGELGSVLTFNSWLDEGTTPGFQCNDPENATTTGAACTADPEEGDNIFNGVEEYFWIDESVDEASEGPFNQSDVLAAAYVAHSCSVATGDTDYGDCHGLAEDGRMVGSATYYWGLAWNVPPETGNEIQTDSLVTDMVFTATQHRNNPDFVCPVLDTNNQLPVVGAQDLASFVAPASCDVTVDDDFASSTPGSQYLTIQSAIDDTSNVADGSVICVADGEYDEFVVDRPLTVAGLTNPALGSAHVTPSAPTVTELALITSSDVSVTGMHFHGTGTAFTGSQTAGVEISSTGGDIDNVNISYNVIENLSATNANAANKGIQWFSDADDGDVLTNSTFSYNLISDIKATSKGAYGIQTVGATNGLTMAYNTIEDIDGAWGAGIAMDTKDTGLTSVTGTSIHHNHIFDALGANEVGLQVEFKVAASDVSANMNNLASALQGGGNTDLNTEGVLNVEGNWWGDLDPSDQVLGDVDYDPFETSAFPLI